MPSKQTSSARKRTHIRQSDVPIEGLERALRIATAVADHGGSAKPLHVATAIQVKPTSSGFRTMCGAAVAYGLTKGSYSAQVIQLTPLGRQAVDTNDRDSAADAKVEAFLKPRIIDQFLRSYDSKALPSRDVALNVLETLSVPKERGEKAFDLIRSGVRSLGLFSSIGSQEFVDLSRRPAKLESSPSEARDEEPTAEPETPAQLADPSSTAEDVAPIALESSRLLEERKKRVFVAHGKNTSFIGASGFCVGG